MDIITVLGSNVGRLVMIVGGAISVASLCYGGIMWITAQGEPQKIAQARSSLIGVLVGLIIIGVGPFIPGLISDQVIEPAGGVSIESDVGLNCDDVLRSQFVFQRGASTADKMNTVISQIQAQRSECVSDVWNPSVTDIPDSSPAAKPDTCFGYRAVRGYVRDRRATFEVGESVVPRGLREGNVAAGAVRAASGRDSDNNIIVYWDPADGRPSDNAKCWLYVSRLNSWSENY